MKKYVLLLVLIVVATACGPKKSDYQRKVQDPELIHRSIKQITDVIVFDIFSPPVASRIYSYVSVAGYEALRQGDDRFLTLAGQLNGFGETPKPKPGVEYCFPLASVQAILKVGRSLVFSEDKMEKFYSGIMKEFKNAGVPDDVFERSVAYGNEVAAHVMMWASKDNYKQTRSFPKYTILNDAATWKPTPPAYMDAVEPHWNKIRPFVMDSAQEFKCAPPVPFSAQKGSPFYESAREIYQIGVDLSPEQRAIASFWDCNPFVMNVKGHVMFATKKISPGGHWMNITRVTCNARKADIGQTAEAYVRVALSLADGFISCWDEKYRSRVIRPETYINQYIDDKWVPLLQTPPFPEHSSGHSVISAAAAVTLTKLFGDNFAFTDSTEVEFRLPARRFTSFFQAADEAAVSRMYGGIHYKRACEAGVVQGKAVGEFIGTRVKTRMK